MAEDLTALTKKLNLKKALEELKRGNASLFEQRFFYHNQELSYIKSQIARNNYKAKILKEYKDFIDLVISENIHSVKQMTVKIFIWSLDVNNYDNAFKLFDFCYKNHYLLPVNFKRDLANFFTEEVGKNAELNRIKNKRFNKKDIEKLLKISKNLNINDFINSRNYKEAGYIFLKTNPKKAKKYFLKSLFYNPKTKLKTALKMCDFLILAELENATNNNLKTVRK